eukprot:834051-Prorocentrum_minimum.AAC.1
MKGVRRGMLLIKDGIAFARSSISLRCCDAYMFPGGGQEGVRRGSRRGHEGGHEGGQEGDASQQGRDRLRPVQHLPS